MTKESLTIPEICNGCECWHQVGKVGCCLAKAGPKQDAVKQTEHAVYFHEEFFGKNGAVGVTFYDEHAVGRQSKVDLRCGVDSSGKRTIKLANNVGSFTLESLDQKLDELKVA
ncbi:hypothetical protein FWF74_02280 [Candidatus Saccharibacteria bacterium]|nr:hypothetical protein [Candidatus Saccharibacteria bacterium]MCL1963059.1 hypothetical protein [Candidatus Saccharibacteria bacterium]